ncbi:MAG: putative ABC transporter permease subunit [Dehalococcoidia bacterium]
MGIIKVLLQKEALVFRNSYLKTRRQILIALAWLTLGLAFFGWVTGQIAERIRPLLADIPLTLEMLLITSLLHLILFWLLFSTFSLMLREARSKFYHSPELSLLISSPIPANTLFIFRFLLATSLSKGALMNIAIFVLLPLIALGIASAAPWYYYLFIPLVVYPLLTISASLAILLVMILIKVLSTKRIMQAGAVFGFLSTASWVGFFIIGPERILPRLPNWIDAAEPALAILFPLSDAANALTYLTQGDIAFGLLLRLFFASGVILTSSMLAAKRLYYSGYDRTQTVEAATRKQVERPAREPFSPGRRSNLILVEWKKAARNYEMAQGAIGLLVMLIVYLFIAVVERFTIPEPWHSLIPLAHIAVIGFLASGAVAIFFIPAAIMQDKKALKEQHWLLKAAPFGGREFILCYWLAPFIPQILLGGVILLVLNILTGSSILTILLSLVVFTLLGGAVTVLILALDMAGYAGQRETASVTGGIVRNILPWAYYIVALGILASGLVYAEIGFLGFLHHLPEGLVTTVSGAIFLALTGFTFYYSFRLGARGWERMEI